MRVNVYHEELTEEIEIIWTEPRPGVRYCGLRIFQKSAPELHHRRPLPGKPETGDDDRSAVTFWVGSLAHARRFVGVLADAIVREEARAGAFEPEPHVPCAESHGKGGTSSVQREMLRELHPGGDFS